MFYFPSAKAMMVWQASAIVEKVCEVWGLTEKEYFERGAFEKPTWLQNKLVSHHLKRTYGVIEHVPRFESGEFRLDPGYGLYIPKWKDGKITEIKWWTMRQVLKGSSSVQTLKGRSLDF